MLVNIKGVIVMNTVSARIPAYSFPMAQGNRFSNASSQTPGAYAVTPVRYGAMSSKGSAGVFLTALLVAAALYRATGGGGSSVDSALRDKFIAEEVLADYKATSVAQGGAEARGASNAATETALAAAKATLEQAIAAQPIYAEGTEVAGRAAEDAKATAERAELITKATADAVSHGVVPGSDFPAAGAIAPQAAP